MTVNTYDLFEGTLTLGSGPLAVAGQVTACRVEVTENVTETEAIPVLSGEELPASSSETFSYVLAGTFLQDLIAGGVQDWSWINKGTEQPFTFVPNTALGREVAGTLKPVPLQVGGDVARPGAGDPPSADFSWRCVGEPTFGDVAP